MVSEGLEGGLLWHVIMPPPEYAGNTFATHRRGESTRCSKFSSVPSSPLAFLCHLDKVFFWDVKEVLTSLSAPRLLLAPSTRSSLCRSQQRQRCAPRSDCTLSPECSTVVSLFLNITNQTPIPGQRHRDGQTRRKTGRRTYHRPK